MICQLCFGSGSLRDGQRCPACGVYAPMTRQSVPSDRVVSGFERVRNGPEPGLVAMETRRILVTDINS